MFDRLKTTLADFFQQADLVLLSLCCAATVFGMVLIASATRYMGTYRYVVVQGAAMAIGIVLYIVLSLADVEMLVKRWKWIVGFNVGMILLLYPFGVSVSGNRAWLHFPGMPVNIGPAELIKITFTLLLAKQLEWLREEKRDLKSPWAALFVGGHLLALCVLYFVVSRDMGNALVFIFIFVCMTFLAGFAIRWYLVAGAAGTGGVFALWKLGAIPGYMVDRFHAIADHSFEPLVAGWQQTRSLLALGSGQLLGQGLFNGTQTQSSYKSSLPARWTDFIFSVAGEELGLIGCLAIVFLLCAIIIRCLIVARRAQSSYASYVCIGLAAMLVFQTIENIGMCLFVMPVVGLTLPFFSYGGSSIVTLYAAMGVVSGIKMRSIPPRIRLR